MESFTITCHERQGSFTQTLVVLYCIRTGMSKNKHHDCPVPSPIVCRNDRFSISISQRRKFRNKSLQTDTMTQKLAHHRLTLILVNKLPLNVSH